MASWGEFAKAEPDLAAVGTALFLGRDAPRDPPWLGIGLVATLRADGGPRLAPVCPIAVEDRLLLAAVGPKVRDLERDGRYVLHAFLGRDDAEFALRGRAARNDDPRLRAAATLATAGTGMLVDADRETIFELDIERADAAVWEKVGKPGTHPIRKRWRAP